MIFILIIKDLRDVNNELVRKHFQVQGLVSFLDKLKNSKENTERNDIQKNLIKSGLRDLKEQIEDLSEQEKEIENANVIVDIVEKILEFNKQRQEQGLKILTPNQMLTSFFSSVKSRK